MSVGSVHGYVQCNVTFINLTSACHNAQKNEIAGKEFEMTDKYWLNIVI